MARYGGGFSGCTNYWPALGKTNRQSGDRETMRGTREPNRGDTCQRQQQNLAQAAAPQMGSAPLKHVYDNRGGFVNP